MVQLLQILNILIPTFATLLQLKFQTANQASPFETHELVMLAFCTAMVIYVSALAIQNQLQAGAINWPAIANKIGILSGSLAPIMLLLILVPYLGLSMLFVWILCFVKLAHELCWEIYPLVHDFLETFFKRSPVNGEANTTSDV